MSCTYDYKMVRDSVIIAYFFGSTKGIRGTAHRFGLSPIYVGRIITAYRKKHNIR